MKLTQEEQDAREPELWDVTKACYTGVEIPEHSLFTRCVHNGDVWVAHDPFDKSIVGYALVSGRMMMQSPLLRSIAVLPTHRGIGLAGFLLVEVANYFRVAGMRSITLHCKINNPAQTLYFKNGYRVTAILRNYYAPEGDGLEMRKML